MKRVLSAGLGLATIAGVIVWVVVSHGGSSSKAAAAATPHKTAIAQRKDVVHNATYDGTTQVREVGQLHAARPGTVTWLPAEGAVVKPGEVLFRVDEQPTYLLTGDIPMYRDLDIGVADGTDVRQIEVNLIAGGYGGTTLTDADAHFDSATRAAVRAWQTATGQPVTGRVSHTDVVFSPSVVVIGDEQAKVGDSVGPGASIAKLIDQYVEVTVTAKATDHDELAVGRTVSLGSDVPPRTAVVRQQDSDPSGGLQVTLDLKQPLAYTHAGESLKVTVELERHANVVTVPVNALLALAEGGYAVEVADPNGTHLAPVTVGLFADGAVEVNGIDSGTTVVVPA